MKFIDDYQEPYDAEHCKPIISINEQMKLMAEAFTNIGKLIEEKLIPTIQAFIEYGLPIVKRTVDIVLKTYPNKRVVHLATHGRGRVRKKNIKRIMKYVERGCKQ